MLGLFFHQYKDWLDLAPQMCQSEGEYIVKWDGFYMQDKYRELAFPNFQSDAVQSRNFNYGHHHENNALLTFLNRFENKHVHQIGMCGVDDECLRGRVKIYDARNGERMSELPYTYLCLPDFYATWHSKKDGACKGGGGRGQITC